MSSSPFAQSLAALFRTLPWWVSVPPIGLISYGTYSGLIPQARWISTRTSELLFGRSILQKLLDGFGISFLKKQGKALVASSGLELLLRSTVWLIVTRTLSGALTSFGISSILNNLVSKFCGTSLAQPIGGPSQSQQGTSSNAAALQSFVLIEASLERVESKLDFLLERVRRPIFKQLPPFFKLDSSKIEL